MVSLQPSVNEIFKVQEYNDTQPTSLGPLCPELGTPP